LPAPPPEKPPPPPKPPPENPPPELPGGPPNINGPAEPLVVLLLVPPRGGLPPPFKKSIMKNIMIKIINTIKAILPKPLLRGSSSVNFVLSYPYLFAIPSQTAPYTLVNPLLNFEP